MKIDISTIVNSINKKTTFDVELELSEISETFWIDLTKIDLEELAFESQRKFLWNYLR